MLNEYSRQSNTFSKGDKQLSFHITDVMDMRHCIRCMLAHHFISIVMQKSTRQRKPKNLCESQNYIALSDFWDRRSKEKKKQTHTKINPHKPHTNIMVSIPLFFISSTEREGKKQENSHMSFHIYSLSASVSQHISTPESLIITSCVFTLSTCSCL